jgi:hypothetical protein
MHEVIYERLKAVAREGKTITYGEIAPLANLDMANDTDRIKTPRYCRKSAILSFGTIARCCRYKPTCKS